MSRFVGAFLLLCLHVGFTYEMDCSYYYGTSSNFVENLIGKNPNKCPGIIESISNPSKSYCCYDISNNRIYCCDAEEFALKTGLGIIVPVIITAAIIISLIVCCISCLCCSCCPWYRRRHRGTVYGKVQAPNVHVIQTPANTPPRYVSQDQAQSNYPTPYPTQYPTPYSINPPGLPQHPPPQYTSEPYAKQAPYNPAYPPQ